MHVFLILVQGCDNVELVGNGLCNDETNNAGCYYDGGDCCSLNANTDYCNECACYIQGTCTAGYHPLVGNGFCNDETNIAGCYDGGDCCGYDINSEHCIECICFHQETCAIGIDHSFVADGFCNDETNNLECGYDGGDCCPHPDLVGNGFCNDETNNLGCNYDGGDCCVNVNTDYCSYCKCLGGGAVTSPEFPQMYDNYLDLTWLIQVQTGQKIETNFLYFEVEPHSTCK